MPTTVPPIVVAESRATAVFFEVCSVHGWLVLWPASFFDCDELLELLLDSLEFLLESLEFLLESFEPFDEFPEPADELPESDWFAAEKPPATVRHAEVDSARAAIAIAGRRDMDA